MRNTKKRFKYIKIICKIHFEKTNTLMPSFLHAKKIYACPKAKE